MKQKTVRYGEGKPDKMQLRRFVPDTDFDRIKDWITDGKAHAMWCANRFQYPLEKENFVKVLLELAQRTGDIPFAAVTDEGDIAGFFCYSVPPDSGEGRLKFIVVDPACRGRGTAREMLRLILLYAAQQKNVKTVSLCVFPENIRAKKCYEKAGFRETGTDPQAFSYQEEVWDRCHMAVQVKERQADDRQTGG